MTERFQAVVIGGGITGASVAYHLGLDAPGLGLHGRHHSGAVELDAGRARVGHHACSHVARRPRQRVGGGVRIQVTVTRDPYRAVQRVGRDHGHEAPGFVRGDQLHVQADATRAARAAL